METVGPQGAGARSLALVMALPALIGLGAWTLDRAWRAVARAELEVAADLAAAAGAARLDGSPTGLERAVEGAIRAASRNTAGGQPVLLRPEDVHTGFRDPGTGAFTPSADPARTDSVQVRVVQGEQVAVQAVATRRGAAGRAW
jgi:hypothetical protein